MLAGIMREGVQYCVSNSLILGDIGLQAFERSQPDGRVLVITKAYHQTISHGALGSSLAPVPDAALVGKQNDRVRPDPIICGGFCADQKKLANLRIVERALHCLWGHAIVSYLNDLAVGSLNDTADVCDCAVSGISEDRRLRDLRLVRNLIAIRKVAAQKAHAKQECDQCRGTLYMAQPAVYCADA